MTESRGELDRHPDRERWNARYRAAGFTPSFAPHPLAEQSLSMPLPDGPVADLACGASGSALLAAALGRHVDAVDVSDAALRLLREEAQRRGLAGLITSIQADLAEWRLQHQAYALVICTGFWDSRVFARAATAVAPGGLLAWEAFTDQARQVRPSLPAKWCLGPGEPASLLPAGYRVLGQQDVGDAGHGARRRIVARRQP